MNTTTSTSAEADQAHTLRLLTGAMMVRDARQQATARTLVVSVASGKGGVGKTVIAANLAIFFSQQARKTLLVDGDLGLANLHIALGVQPQLTLLDVIKSSVPIEQVLSSAPGGVTLLPAYAGNYELANLGLYEQRRLFASVDVLAEQFDTLVVDIPAGANASAVSLAAAAQIPVIVCTPEPTALADAYALIKFLRRRAGIARVELVVNQVSDQGEGEEVYARISGLADRFLDCSVGYLGAVVRDPTISLCLRRQRPLLIEEPDCPAAMCIKEIARRLVRIAPQSGVGSGMQLFWKKLVGAVP